MLEANDVSHVLRTYTIAVQAKKKWKKKKLNQEIGSKRNFPLNHPQF